MADDSPAPGSADRDLAAALHEVGNALTALLGWLESAEEQAKGALEDGEGASDPRAALSVTVEAIAIATARARRAHRIARRAIASGSEAAIPGSSGRTLPPDDPPPPESLEAVLAETTTGLSPMAARQGVVLRTAIDDELGGAVVESGERLLQILTNLVMNAIAVTPSGGTIHLQARPLPPAKRATRGLAIVVTDGGPGIPDAQRAQLFERGVSNRPGGAGIGLSHARALALEEGGRITLAPYRPGKGASFEIEWPVSDGVPSAVPRTTRAAQLDGVHVVVLEDDAAVVELLETVLAARGASVSIVRTLDALLDAMSCRPADVALVDASPLGRDIEATLRDLCERHPTTHLVLISGAPEPGTIAERLALTWVRKPFEVTEIVDVLRAVRGSSRPGR